MKSPQAGAAKWSTNTAGAQTAYTDGVQGTSVDVMGKAIAAAPQAAANYAQSISSGAWARAIQASGGTANWKAMTVAKAGNFSTGVSVGTPKYAAAAQKLYPAIEQIVNGLPARQAGNLGVSLARVQGLMTALHAQKGNFKG